MKHLDLWLEGAAIAFFLFGTFLWGLMKVTKGRYVRKDFLMALLVAGFLVECVLAVAKVIPNLIGLTIIVVMVPLVAAKEKFHRFSEWLETPI